MSAATQTDWFAQQGSAPNPPVSSAPAPGNGGDWFAQQLSSQNLPKPANTGGVSGSWTPESPFSPEAIMAPQPWYERSLRYLGGEGEGVADWVKNFVLGAAQTAVDVGGLTNPGTAQTALPAFGRDIAGIVKAPIETIKNIPDIVNIDPRKSANEILNLAATEEGVRGGVEGIKNVKATVAARTAQRIAQQAEDAAALQRVSELRGAATMKQINDATQAAQQEVGQAVEKINSADQADIAARGPRDAGIQLKTVESAIDQARKSLQTLGQKNPAAEAALQRLESFRYGRATFEEAKQIRQDLYLAKSVSAPGQAVVAAGYDALTKLMKQRAEELGLGKTFDFYNKNYRVLHGSEYAESHGPILDKLRNAPNSDAFWEEVRKPSNHTQIERLENDLQNYGLKPHQISKSAAELQKVAQYIDQYYKGNQGGFMGVFRSLFTRPKSSIPAYLGGHLIGNALLPGGGFVTGLMSVNAINNYLDHLIGTQLADEMGRPGIRSLLQRMPNETPKIATIGDQMKSKGQPPLTSQSFGGNGNTPPPTPAEEPKLVQSNGTPNEEPSGGTPNEPVNLTPNGSGESGASLEAINRTASEKAAGQRYVSVDTRSGKETPIIGTDALDRASNPQPFERTYKVGPNGREQVAEGTHAKASRELQQTEQQVREVLNKAKSINKARQAEKVIEKAKEDLSPEEYKIAKDYVEQELARRKGLRTGKLESKP